MKRSHVLALVPMVALILALGACSQPAAAPTAAPAKAGQPAAAAQPTAAPAKKVDWPDKTKSITLVNPFAAGGDVDVQARVLTPLVEKELGISIQIVAKPGAAGQIAWTELAQAKPDGYTLGYISVPNLETVYLDPERKAIFNRKSFVPIALHSWEPGAIVTLPSKPYNTLKDFVEAARAKPEGVVAADAGILNAGNLAILQLQDIAKVKFANVHFDGGAPLVTAALGGQVDAAFTFVPIVTPHYKNKTLRVLAVVDDQPSRHLPDIPTIVQAGYKATAFTSSIRGIFTPAGTPSEVVEILRGAFKRAMENPEHDKKMEELFFHPRRMTPEQIDALILQVESDVQPYMKLAQVK